MLNKFWVISQSSELSLLFEAHTVSSLIAVAASGDSSCIACQTKWGDLVLSVTVFHLVLLFFFFVLTRQIKLSGQHLRIGKEKSATMECCFPIHEGMRRRFCYFLPFAIPFTNSSVLFMPHGGLPRFAAGLLTLGSSRQLSMAAGRSGSRPGRSLWLHAFLSCSPKVPNGTEYTEIRAFWVGNMIVDHKSEYICACHAFMVLPITRKPRQSRGGMPQPHLSLFRMCAGTHVVHSFLFIYSTLWVSDVAS